MKPFCSILKHFLPVKNYSTFVINSDSIKKISRDLVIWTLFLILSTVFTYYSFTTPNIQVLAGIFLFQCNLIFYAFGYLRIVPCFVKILRAELVVQLISSSFITQLLFFLSNLREVRTGERYAISFLVFTSFLAYCIYQLPNRHRRILFTNRTKMDVLINCWIISNLSYFNLFYIQGLHIVVSSEESDTKNNWILYDSSYIFKMFILVFAQAFAYHVSYIENRQSLIDPRKPRNPRSG